ncbi:hypothetical protein ACFPRL_18985 [Pseudoclavibacter helvolus]
MPSMIVDLLTWLVLSRGRTSPGRRFDPGGPTRADCFLLVNRV